MERHAIKQAGRTVGIIVGREGVYFRNLATQMATQQDIKQKGLTAVKL